MSAPEGPDDGHTFRFSVRVRSSSSVVGDPHHTDAPAFDGPVLTQDIRAWSLAAALEKAQQIPLSEWFRAAQEAEALDPNRPDLGIGLACPRCGHKVICGDSYSGVKCSSTTCDWWYCA